jgi:hypothetical protein
MSSLAERNVNSEYVVPHAAAHSSVRQEQVQSTREMHTLYRRLQWYWCKTQLDRVRFCLRRVGVVHPREWAHVDSARTVAAAGGPSLLSQLLGSWWLNTRFGITPELFYRYRLYEPDRARFAELYFDIPEYVSLREHLYRRLTVDKTSLVDKRAFYHACLAASLPAIPLLAEFEGGALTKQYDGADKWLDGDLFSKQATALGGVDAHRWRHERGRYRRSDEAAWTFQDVLDFLARQSVDVPFVLQPLCVNHPEVRAIAAEALSTVRVLTARAVDGKPEVVRAIFRMSVGTGAADNFTAGGIASPIDERTGQLGVASRQYPWNAPQLSHHPDTGEKIEGFTLPYWREVVALALKAHEAFHEFPSVGWDIAITDRGLILVEGNYNWGVNIAQLCHREPIGATQFPVYYLSFLRHASRPQDAAPS